MLYNFCIIRYSLGINREAQRQKGENGMATEKPRYTVSVDKEMFQQIEDFRFAHRYQTRSEATVELIRLGLESLEREKTPGGGYSISDKNDDAAQKKRTVDAPGKGQRAVRRRSAQDRFARQNCFFHKKEAGMPLVGTPASLYKRGT